MKTPSAKKIGQGAFIGLGLLAALAGVFQLGGVVDFAETTTAETAEFCLAFLNQQEDGLGNYSGVIELAEKIAPFLDEF